MVFKALSNSGADSGSTVGLTRKHHNLRQIHSLVKEPTHLCLRLHAHASLAKTRPVRHHQNAKQCHTVLLPFVLNRRKQHRPDATGNVSVVDSGSKLGYFSKTESRHKVRESKMERKDKEKSLALTSFALSMAASTSAADGSAAAGKSLALTSLAFSMATSTSAGDGSAEAGKVDGMERHAAEVGTRSYKK